MNNTSTDKNWFDLHITVDYEQREQFIDYCYMNRIKYAEIDMEVMNDIMTSIQEKTTYNDIKSKSILLVDDLNRNGFIIKRVKIESDYECNLLHKYIETHLKFKGNAILPTQTLISKSKIKPEYDIITYRSFNLTVSEFTQKVFDKVKELENIGLKLIGKVEIEKAIFDTNIGHDLKWQQYCGFTMW